MMTMTQLGSAELCSMARELVNVVQQHQKERSANITLHMYSNCVDEEDEICVVAVDKVSGNEKLAVKISLAQLTPVERAQLKLQINLHNDAQANLVRPYHKNNSLLVH